MQIFDISQELFTGNIYPGDLSPSKETVSSIDEGSNYNLTNIQMCAHNATHIDAPFHFINNGKTIDKLDLNKCIGEASVIEFNGDITANDIKKILPYCAKRLLTKGNNVLTLEAVNELLQNDIILIGTESQSVGAINSPLETHVKLLEKEIIILEGLCLSNIEEGNYMLFCPPIKLGGLDGAPCRAVLVRF